TGEATAQYLTKSLYNKAPSELTASEKETISSLSQLAGGLAGAFTAKANGSSDNQGGSVLTAVAGAETAKRAVENNHLSKQEEDEIFNIVNKFDKKGSLSSYAQERAWYLLSKDAEIDRLIQLHQKNPNALTANQKAYLYHEVKLIANSYPNLSVSDILNTDFSANMVRRDNSKIMNYLDMQKMFKNTPEYRIAEGVYEGVQYLPTMIKAGQVGVPLINKAIHSPVVKNTVIGLGSNASLQFLSGQDFNWFELGSAGIAGAVSPKLSTRDAIRVNMGIAMGGSLVNGGNPLQDVGLAGFGALAGSKFSNPIYSSVASDAIQKFPQILSKGENKQNEN
ncbi:VENN motif pre-toxin domain-containing protein, partial [Avibacterium endocarditidis]